MNSSLNSSTLRQIQLHPSKRAHRLGRHPWILATSILQPPNPPQLGEQVDLVQADGRWIGRGLYNPNSRIRIRMYAWDQNQFVDDNLIDSRVERALDLRKHIARQAPHDAMRLIFSEADSLSGLIADRFGDHLVIHMTAAALMPWIDRIAAKLQQHMDAQSVTLHVDDKTAKSEGIPPQVRTLSGTSPTEPILLNENGLVWGVDLNEGQKTGYYLDQRDNRLAAAGWTPPQADVLDLCTYAGGFALTIAKHSHTSSITAIDSSSKALDLAQANAARNGLEGRVDWEQNDFFKALSERVEARKLYDMIVLDPPRLAGSRDQLARAMAAYHRLNYLAMRSLRPGGILVTCSCSGRVTRGDFFDMLHGVAVRARRDVQVLENRGAAPDHPVSIHCPETDYLKCVIARVL